MYGSPEFRLPKEMVQHEVEGLKELGVDIECNMVIGKVLTVDELMNDYGFEAIYIASEMCRRDRFQADHWPPWGAAERGGAVCLHPQVVPGAGLYQPAVPLHRGGIFVLLPLLHPWFPPPSRLSVPQAT